MNDTSPRRKGILDNLIDKDGLKTEVTVSITNQTLSRSIIALLISGVSLMVIGLMVRQFFPNPQLMALQNELKQIKDLIQR